MTLSCPTCYYRFAADAAAFAVSCPMCDAPVAVPATPVASRKSTASSVLPPKRSRNLWARFGVISVSILLVLISLCGGAGYLVFDYVTDPEFVTHDDAEGRFSIEFPGKPWRANPISWGHGGITSFPMVAYERTWPDETYAIAWRDLDEEELQFGPEANLNAVIDGATSFNPILKEVIRRESLTVNGHPAVEVLLAVHISQGKGFLRVVLAGNRLCVLSVGGAWIQDDSVRARHFLNSLQTR